jgi:hypothetical protein
MALWTVIADYRGGTYISQVRAAGVTQALKQWAKSFPQVKGSFVGAKTRQKLMGAVCDNEAKPVPIETVRNTWYWSHFALHPRFVVHLVKTSSK